MSAHNKKRYGEVKQVEIGGSISITEALQQAQMRLIEAEVMDVSDVTPVDVLKYTTLKDL
jgi:hypothetical protein